MSPVMPNTDKVAAGYAVVFAKPWSALTPATLPADTLGLFEPWADGWTYTGGTAEGWKLSFSTKTTDLRIEEQSTAVARVAESKDMSVTGNLAQDTLDSMVLSYGGGTIATTAAGSGQPGKRVLTLNNELAIWVVGIEIKNEFGMPRRVLIPKAVAGSDSETEYKRTSMRTYPVTFGSICDPGLIQIVNIEAAAL